MWWFGFCILIIQNKVWKKKYFDISGCKIVEKKIKIKKKIKKKVLVFWGSLRGYGGFGVLGFRCSLIDLEVV